jgi:phosphoenolpyruvate synthase/pyruvate phosphate dikinase
MASEPYVVWLQECVTDNAPLVGGKAIGLGSLMREGFQVPPGFTVSTRAYREHVEANHLDAQLARIVADAQSFESQQHAADEIRALFEQSRPSTALRDEVLTAHEKLCTGNATQPVAVRSSATAEDMADASFAGQQETYLWIISGEQVMQNVVRCWASLFTPQAVAYRAHRNIPVDHLAMGVVVQCMVPAEAAGVMLTIDPVNGDRSQISIEAAYGLGAAVVNGEVTPDRFSVDKVTLEIRSRAIETKGQAYRFDPAEQGTRLTPVPPDQQSQPCIDDAEVIQLATLGKRMEQAMGRAQDMEWAIGRAASGEREVFLLQARPETVWSQKPHPPVASAGSSVMDRILQSMRTQA